MSYVQETRAALGLLPASDEELVAALLAIRTACSSGEVAQEFILLTVQEPDGSAQVEILLGGMDIYCPNNGAAQLARNALDGLNDLPVRVDVDRCSIDQFFGRVGGTITNDHDQEVDAIIDARISYGGESFLLHAELIALAPGATETWDTGLTYLQSTARKWGPCEGVVASLSSVTESISIDGLYQLDLGDADYGDLVGVEFLLATVKCDEANCDVSVAATLDEATALDYGDKYYEWYLRGERSEPNRISGVDVTDMCGYERDILWSIDFRPDGTVSFEQDLIVCSQFNNDRRTLSGYRVEASTSTSTPATGPSNKTMVPATVAPRPTTTIPFEGSVATPALLRVAGVEPDDVLFVRAGPGSHFESVGPLGPFERGIIPVGGSEMVDGAPWIEVQGLETRGWVNANFLTEDL